MCATSQLSTAAADRHTACCKIDWSRGWTNCWLYSGQGQGVVSSPKHRERLWDPRSFLFNGCPSSFPAMKRSGCPSTTDVKNEWSDTSTSPICLQGQLYIHLCCLDEANSYHSGVTFPLFLVWEVFALLSFTRAWRQLLGRPEIRKLQLLSASPVAIRAMKLAEHVERMVHMKVCVAF